MPVVAEPRMLNAPVPKTPLPPDDIPGVTRPMTYEEYLAPPEEMARYDIIGGYKKYRLYGESHLASPTLEHQNIVLNIGGLFRTFQKADMGFVVVAPCDVLISRSPRLRSRQPDVLFVSRERFAGYDKTNPAPLSPAPELVVDVLSPSDKPGVLAAKIADYRAIGVQEVWVLRTEPRTVEVVRLSEDEIDTVTIYEAGQTVQSVFFPGLAAAVDEVFAQ